MINYNLKECDKKIEASLEGKEGKREFYCCKHCNLWEQNEI